MTDPLRLTYGDDSQRITCPHMGEAVPSSAVNITIYDSSKTELLAATAATKGSLSSTLAVAAVAGARSITLADAAGISVDQPIVLTDDFGRTELAMAEGGETSNDVVKLRDPLVRSYAIGDAVDSALIYHDADISDTDDFPIGIYYTALFACSDWDYPRPVCFRVVQFPSRECPITYEHVRSAFSTVGILRDSYDQPDLDDVRLAAWNFMEADLLAGGRDPATLRDQERLSMAGGYLAAALFLVARGGDETSERLAGNPIGTGGFFKVYFERIMKIPHWFDRDQDLVRDEGETRRPTRRVLRRGL